MAYNKQTTFPLKLLRESFTFRYIKAKETNVLIDSLKTSKPLGPSKIPAWAIEDAKAALAEPLCYLINQFITEEKFPQDLKKACVNPLFKNGNTKDPFNYSKSLPEKTKILLLKAIVISHLHYSALILIGLQKSLLTTLEKQLNWGIKNHFYRRKYERSKDLKLRNKILPVSFLLKYHCKKIFFAYSATTFQHIKLNLSLP